MDIESVYKEVGTFRGAAEIGATTPKTGERVVLSANHKAEMPAAPHNYDQVRNLVAARVTKTRAASQPSAYSRRQKLPVMAVLPGTSADSRPTRRWPGGARTTRDAVLGSGSPVMCLPSRRP